MKTFFIKIDEIFTSDEYRSFIDFCTSSEIYYTYELLDVDYTNYQDKYSADDSLVAKIKALILRYENYEILIPRGGLSIGHVALDGDIIKAQNSVNQTNDEVINSNSDKINSLFIDLQPQMPFYEMLGISLCDIPDIKIDDLNYQMSGRLSHVLSGNNIRDLVALCKLSGNIVKSYVNAGGKTVQEIIQMLIKCSENGFRNEVTGFWGRNVKINASERISAPTVSRVRRFLLNYWEYGHGETSSLLEQELTYFNKCISVSEVLGDEICRDALLNPTKYQNIFYAFDVYAKECEAMVEFRKEAGCLLSSIPDERKLLQLAPFIDAYMNGREKAQDLRMLLADCEDMRSIQSHLMKMHLSISNQNMVIKFITWIALDLSELYGSMEKVIFKDDRQKALLGCRAAGMSLDECASQINVTRQRIQQIEKMICIKFIRWDLHYNLLQAFSERMNGIKIIQKDIVMKYFGEARTQVLAYLLRSPSLSLFEYDRDIQAFCAKDFDDRDLIKDFLHGLPGFLLEDDLMKRMHTFNIVQYEELILKAVHEKYIKYKTVFSIKRLKKREVYSYVLKLKYPNGYKTGNYDEARNFRKNVENIFGDFSLSTSDTALNTIIKHVGIQCAFRVFIHPSYIPLPADIISELAHEKYPVILERIPQLVQTNKYYRAGIARYIFNRDLFDSFNP